MMSKSYRDSPPGLGVILRELRNSKGLSLDELANLSGISKSMLSQIERDLTNPTFATIWRVTAALGVGVEDVVHRARRTNIELVEVHATPTVTNPDGLCRMRILNPMELASTVEWYEYQAEPGGALVSDPHNRGTIEHLTVVEGVVTVECGDATHVVATGETIRYPADQVHAIRNHGQGYARAFVVVITAKVR